MVTSVERYRSGEGGIGAGQIKEVVYPDGTKRACSYSIVNGQKMKICSKGSADLSAGSETRTTFDALGNVASQESWALDFGGVPNNSVRLETYSESNLDGLGRPRTFTRSFEAPSGGTAPPDQVSSRIYACCGLRSETDITGVVTNYHYDHLVRMETATRLGGGIC